MSRLWSRPDRATEPNRARRRSRRASTRWLPAPLLALALCTALPAQADTGRKVFDAAVLRPLGFVQVVVGAVLFPVFYLGSLATGGSDSVVKVCIDDPVEQTFRKPLGDF